ncbi:MAG TPA: hypothetical protein VLX92_15940 [Kofleriaceae bacterium]|nr:hypothetical protein [Kofleriaceae bacterium]
MRLVLALALFTACSRATPAQAQPAPRPAPAVAPTPALPPIPTPQYPEPPRQHATWSPPRTALPAAVVAAAQKLFDQGLADPRGCEYRELELEVGEAWQGAASPMKTHGWVLPGPAGGERFAVAWNGLVYRARSVGALADVAKDARAILAADAAARAQSEKDNPGFGYHRFPASGEGYAVATETVTPTKAILLLRLGQSALAEQLWKTAVERTDDPYATLAEDWLWAMFERGITAHMRGDVALAIESWRRLPALAKAMPPPAAGTRGVDFLGDIDALLADERRRATYPQPPLDLARLAMLPQPERIARLVAALDQVAARQMGQPGGVALGEDPIIQALIKEGEPAVEPLITAFETDGRRTRSVQFWRDFARQRDVLTVYEAAYCALSGVLDMSFFSPASTGDNLTARGSEGRLAVGKQLRAYWAKWKGVPLIERQYRMFADDKLDADKWLTAASQITQPTNVSVVPSSSIDQWVTTEPLPAGTKPKLRGEALRGKTSPSVTALFLRRLPAMTDYRHQAALLEAFAAWDPAAARPELAKWARAQIASWSTGEDHGDKPYIGAAIAELTTARVDAGDPGALADYAAWIVKTSPAEAEFNAVAWFAPMVAHPKAPEIAGAARTVFGSSPWVPLLSEKSSYYVLDLIGSDLVHVPAFRDYLLRELGNHTKIGTVRMRKGDIDVQALGFSQSSGIDDKDPLAPKEGTVLTLRYADQVADSLSSREGAPKFRRYWPEAERDKALAAVAAWLRTQ